MQKPNFGFLIFAYALFIWSVIWKGIALWRSCKLGQRNWFIALLILNTAGVLEIVYLFYFCKQKLTLEEVKTWKNVFSSKKRP